jgi:hypothetical protein
MVPTMKYFLMFDVEFRDEDPNILPPFIFFELDDLGWETRKIHFYAAGTVVWIDSEHEYGTVGLSEKRRDAARGDFIKEDFPTIEISARVFEKTWRDAVEHGSPPGPGTAAHTRPNQTSDDEK